MTITEFLASIEMTQYQSQFDDNDIDYNSLSSLTADDLKEIGIASLGHRKKIIAAIPKEENDSAASQEAAPSAQSAPNVSQPIKTVGADDLVVSKRGISFGIDFFFIVSLIIFERLFITHSGQMFHHVLLLVYGLYFLPELFTGQSLGKRITKIKIFNRDGSEASTANLFKRYAIKTGPIAIMWLIVVFGGSQMANPLGPAENLSDLATDEHSWKVVLFLSLVVVLFYLLILNSLNKVLNEKAVEAMHDTLSKTKMGLVESTD